MRSMTRRLLGVVLALALHGCATFVPPPARTAAAPQQPAPHADQAWARVLEQFVDAQGRVDFAGLRAAPADLHTMVRHVAATPVESLAPGPMRLAHVINSYNALSMFNVIELGIPASNQSLWSRAQFFITRTFDVGGKRLSLYDFENKVIRPMGEPRIHWALNCSAVSCPTLPRTPFSAGPLDAQLEREARLFFSDSKHVRVDHDQRVIWLSEIFSFFPEDFVPLHAPSFAAYASRYTPAPLPSDYVTRFIPYDWTIARQPKP
jgi:hypothetical protein